jgi:hypothetical protein
MALVPTLTITDTTTFTDAVSFSVSDSLTTGTPSQGLTKVTITTSDDQELVDNAVSGVRYFFAKNHDTSNFVVLQTTASVQYARLSPGEWCFFPINDGAGLEARADTASCVLEYAYWAKG